MNWSSWLHRLRRRRTIEITTGGKWFLALTVAFGVTAVLSGNSILYFLESLLLGLLILSGILSDRMLWNLDVRWQMRPVHAERLADDRILVTNRSRLSALSVELGEWTSRGFELRGFIPYIRGKSTLEVQPAGAPYAERGLHEWSGRVVATRFPFGFARKLKWIDSEGQRWVRPSIDEKSIEEKVLSKTTTAGASEYEEGSIRPFHVGEDFRDIAWIYSATLKGPHFQRARSHSPELTSLRLESKDLSGAALEAHLSALASELVVSERIGIPSELWIPIPSEADHVITDVHEALETLAKHPKA